MNSYELVTELMCKYGIKVRMEYRNDIDKTPRFYFENGFYKSDGSAYLQDDADGNAQLHTRYDQQCLIENIFDIGHVSYRWYETSKFRYDGWNLPAEEWAQFYTNLGYGKLVIRCARIAEWNPIK